MAKTGRQSFQFMLRLPDDLRERLRVAAETTGRSMTAEIIARLEGVLDRDDQGAFKVWFPPDLLERVLDEAKKSEVDPNLLIMDAVEKEFPAPKPPGFDRLVKQLREAIEQNPSATDEAVRHFLDAVDSGKPPGRSIPWDKAK